ncbi:MAG: terminase small subunit [Chlorobiales bacterium]|nr:terminase small subunit [Chlorobiales bacterium]
MKDSEHRLTPKQDQFCREYLVDMNATQAAIRAGYSAKTADRIGAELLGKTWVSAMVEELKKKRAEKLDISENRILAEIASIAFSNVGDLVDDNGKFIEIKKLKPSTLRAIKSVRRKRFVEDGREGEIISIEFHPKLPALEKICEIKGITAPPVQQRPVEVTINVTGNADMINQKPVAVTGSPGYNATA